MKSIYLLPASLAMAAVPVFARQPAPVVEQVIVTGTYHPLTAKQITASVSVLDQASIGQLNKTNLADLLESVPGVLIERQGGPGGLAVASLRGGETNYTLVMLDGVAMNDPGNSRGGAFDLGSITVESIERIEIVRGPQSAIYGADALGGVINIITLRPAKGHRQTLSISAGSDDYQQAGASASGTSGAVDYALQARVRDSGEPVAGSTAEGSEINVRLGWQPVDAHRLSASFRYFDGERTSYPEQSGGPEFALSPRLDHTDFTDKSTALGWQYQAAEFWKSQVQATLYQRDEVFASPGIAPYGAVPPNGADTDFERQQISWINTLGQPGTFWGNLGVEQRREAGDSRGYLDFGMLMPPDFSLDRRTDSVFADINSQTTDKLVLQASLRNDETGDFGNRSSARFGVQYQITEPITLHANVGNGYKLPSFFALGHPLVGNKDLKPEQVDSWDIGIAWTLSGQLSTGIDYFANDFRDPIDFDSERFTNVNREQVKTSGAEWQLQWRSEDGRINLRGHATYTDIDVKDNASVLTGRPQWQAGLALAWQINGHWRSSLDYQRIGKQFATSQHTGTATLHELGVYQRVNASLFWSISQSLVMDLAVENLFDTDAATAVGFPVAGLSARVGLRWTIL